MKKIEWSEFQKASWELEMEGVEKDHPHYLKLIELKVKELRRTIDA